MRSWIACLLVLVAFGGLATADDNKTKAALHYKQGKAFLDSKKYDEAIAEYRQAHALDNQPAHLFNIARAYHLKNDAKAAIEAYTAYLVADPNTARAKEVREHIVALTQQLTDETAKLDEATKRKRLDDARAKAAGHVKQAEAFATAGAWVKSGDEHRAAAAADGDPAHLLAAADAYAKAPDLAKQRDAYAAYLEKVSSDPIRTKLAETTRAIEKAEQQTRAKATTRSARPLHTPRKLGFGGELRAGYHTTGDYDEGVGPQHARNKAGTHLIAGAFADSWVWPVQRVQLGLRIKRIAVGYTAIPDCGDDSSNHGNCPSNIKVVTIGPALALETTFVRRGNFNAHLLVGGSVGFGIQKTAAIGGLQARDEPITGLNPDVGVELGVGLRFGQITVDALAQLSVMQVSKDLDVGRARGFGLSLGWSSAR